MAWWDPNDPAVKAFLGPQEQPAGLLGVPNYTSLPRPRSDQPFQMAPNMFGYNPDKPMQVAQGPAQAAAAPSFPALPNFDISSAYANLYSKEKAAAPAAPQAAPTARMAPAVQQPGTVAGQQPGTVTGLVRTYSPEEWNAMHGFKQDAQQAPAAPFSPSKYPTPTGEFKMQWTPQELGGMADKLYGPTPYYQPPGLDPATAAAAYTAQKTYALDPRERTGNPYEPTLSLMQGPYRGVIDTQYRDVPNPAYASWANQNEQNRGAFVQALLGESGRAQGQLGKFGADMSLQQLRNIGQLDVAKAAHDGAGLNAGFAAKAATSDAAPYLQDYAARLALHNQHPDKYPLPPEPAVGFAESKKLQQFFPPDKTPDKEGLAAYLSNQRFITPQGTFKPEAIAQLQPVLAENMYRFGGADKFNRETANDLIYEMSKGGVNQAGGFTLSRPKPHTYVLTNPSIGTYTYVANPLNETQFGLARSIMRKGDSESKAKGKALLLALGLAPEQVPQMPQGVGQ